MVYEINKNNLKIIRSFEYKKSLMIPSMEEIRSKNKESLIWKRSMKSLYDEWCVHNALYKLGILRSHTADDDLNYPNNFEWAYRIFAPLARLIIR